MSRSPYFLPFRVFGLVFAAWVVSGCGGHSQYGVSVPDSGAPLDGEVPTLDGALLDGQTVLPDGAILPPPTRAWLTARSRPTAVS